METKCDDCGKIDTLCAFSENENYYVCLTQGALFFSESA
jgi:hypothetical protein